MKYSKEHLEEVERYAVSLDLDPRLIHIPRTKDQADALQEAMFIILCNRGDYQDAKALSPHDPYREHTKALKALDTLMDHLKTHYRYSTLWERQDLKQLRDKLDIEQRDFRTKPIMSGMIHDIEELLSEAGFSQTAIDKDLLPIFKEMVKKQ